MSKHNNKSQAKHSSLFRGVLFFCRWSTRLFFLFVIVFVLIELSVIVVEKISLHTLSNKSTDEMTEFWAKGRGHRDPFPYIMFYPQPNLDVQDRYFGKQRSHLVTNNLGFRYKNDITSNKEPEEVRIFMLGGSVVFNGKTNRTTISGMLEDRLNGMKNRKYNYRCINAGTASFISDQELALLIHVIIDLKPDVVIVFDGFNDLWFPFYYEPRIGYPINWSAYENAFRNNTQIKEVMRSIDFFDGILSTSRLITRFRPDWTLENRVTQAFYKQMTKEHPIPPVPDIVEHLKLNWSKMYQFVRVHGVDVICILQPGNPEIRDKPFVEEFYSSMNEYIGYESQQLSMPYYTFDRILDGKPDFFVPGDPVHTWDEGHRIYVDEMMKILRKEAII